MTTRAEKYPEAVAAVRFARAESRSGRTDFPRMCLRFVRICWGVPLRYRTAREAWEKAAKKHPYTHVNAIPFGAPVFSSRPNAGSDDAGHVFIACGWDDKGRRIFRGNDVKVLGGISAFRIDTITEGWGHTILGWTEDLNGVPLKLGPTRKVRKS